MNQLHPLAVSGRKAEDRRHPPPAAAGLEKNSPARLRAYRENKQGIGQHKRRTLGVQAPLQTGGGSVGTYRELDQAGLAA